MEEHTQDFALLRQIARHDLIHLLESTSGQKDLVIEPILMKPLDMIATMSLLLQHGVNKIYQLDGDKPLPWGINTERRIYLVKPTIYNTKFITSHVLAEPKRKFSVVFVPRRLVSCDFVFEQQGVIGMLDIKEFNWSLLQLEPDLLTLELPEFAQSCFVDGTNDWTHTVAASLWHLQSLYGPIGQVFGLGTAAKDVHNLTERLFSELGEPRATADQPISYLYLLDRSLDFVSVLLTGLTYESMLSDQFGINCGKIVFGEEVESKLKQPEKAKSRLLSNSDQVYASVRDSHMTAVFPFLSAKAKTLQASYDKGQNLNEVKEMKQFVAGELRELKEQHKSLELHICVSEVVLEKSKGMAERLTLEHSNLMGTNLKELLTFAEDWMCQQLSEWPLLKLLCLYSICNSGLPVKDYQSLRSQFLHAYGHSYLLAFHSLKKVGLLTEQSTNVPNILLSKEFTSDLSAKFQTIAKRFNLLTRSDTNIELKFPNDMSYVFSGCYTPLFCQIVSDTLDSGWNQSELRRTFGDVAFSKENSLFGRPTDTRMKKLILVYFIGGVTYAEVAALRLLARKKGFIIVIATTHIIHLPRLHSKKNRFRRLLLDCCQSLSRPFVPIWWCPFGIAQTVFSQLLRSRPSLKFDREIICLEDGGQLGVDWMHPLSTDDQSPIVIFLPGIAGSTYDCSYVLRLVAESSEMAYRSIVINPRALAGVQLLTPRTYNAAATEDTSFVIDLIHKRYPSAPLMAVGFSINEITKSKVFKVY